MTAGPVGGGTAGGRLVPVSPDGGWGWVVVIGSFFIHVFADGFVYSFGVLVETLKTEFNSNNTVAAIIISMLTGLTLGSGPLASAICNKYGCRITTIVGAVISFIGCSLSYFATSIWHIVFSVGVVMGIGFGLMYCPAIIIVTSYFERWRSLATGIAVAGAGVGTVLFSPINDYIMTNYGWRMVFVSFLGILFLCFLCGLTFRPLEFVLVSDDDQEVEMKPIEVKNVNETKDAKYIEETEPLNHKEKEKSSLLAPPTDKIFGRSISQSIDSENAATIRAYKSLGHVGPGSDGENAARVRCSTLGEKDSGYLNRKDVFYTGSIHNVAEFNENPDKYRSTGSLHRGSRHNTVGSNPHSRAHSMHKLDEVRETSEESNETTTDNAEGKDMWKTTSKMVSTSLLRDPIFLLFAISNLLTSVGFNSPLYFLPLHAQEGLHLTSTQGSKVLSVFGLCNTIGRVAFGLIADHKLPLPYGIGNNVERNRLWIYNLSLSICGVLTIFCYKFDTYISLCVYAGMFGFTIASYICLTSVILVDFLGLDKLTNAFGLLLLWQGIGTVFGPPVSGYLADISGAYTLSFIFCGVNLLISGLMLFVVPRFQRKQANQRLISK
ncbi:hypothetical protein WR25_00568 [Diploscapter pachys]|uniref:Major facilitator superfamily (MFS) profile domain-containing protein n=1 Tax=Diploscapter pachys TaxID=2018661 RepID=A0A2A2JK21_9BILA|nr:hypothetical protein WR25_00568 [Diploscapter pachys]